MIQVQLPWYFMLLILAHVNSESNIIEGHCDWTVRSTETTVPAGVYPVNFYACQSGQVTWEKPYGGVEMTFKSAVPQKTGGIYKICITSHSKGFDISTRNKEEFKRLRNYEQQDVTSEICVSSQTRTVIIYVEAVQIGNLDKAMISYRSMFVRYAGYGALRAKDCKICSRQQLINSFCGGDFAVHGNVRSVSTIGGSETRGEAVVVAKKVLHQTANIFEKSSESSEILGNVNFPLYCHWKKQAKHGYLITGNLKEGEGPVIGCRIKFKLWRRLYRKNICDSTIMKT